MKTLLVALASIVSFGGVLSDEHSHEVRDGHRRADREMLTETHQYSANEQVVLWFNTVGPRANRQESYSYGSLELCFGKSSDVEHYHSSLGESLGGLSLAASGADIRFLQPLVNTRLCKVKWTPADVVKLRGAVAQRFWFDAYIDDLPLRGDLGESVKDLPSLYLHKHFDITFNGNNVISANVSLSNLVPLIVPPVSGVLAAEFTYSVAWHKTDVAFENRFDTYLDQEFFEHTVRSFLSLCLLGHHPQPLSLPLPYCPHPHPTSSNH